MQKVWIAGILLVCCVFLIHGLSYGADTATTFTELKTELQSKGMKAEEISGIEKPVKEMIGKGATKNDIKNTLLDFKNKGIKGEELKDSVNSMNELVKSGEAPKEAGNIVSRAAHQAQAQGLKGKELAAKVHEAIKQRKMQMEEMKKKMREGERETKARGEKMKKDTEKESGKQQMKMNKGKGSIMKGKGR